MAEILHQLIGSSSQYLKGLSTTPGGFLAGFLVAIFPVFYDYIFGSRDFHDFQYPVVSQTHHSPVTTSTAAVSRPSGSWLPSPDPTNQRKTTTDGTTLAPTAPSNSTRGPPRHRPFGWSSASFWSPQSAVLVEVFGGSLISVDGNQKSGKLPVEGNGSLSYY